MSKNITYTAENAYCENCGENLTDKLIDEMMDEQLDEVNRFFAIPCECHTVMLFEAEYTVIGDTVDVFGVLQHGHMTESEWSES